MVYWFHTSQRMFHYVAPIVQLLQYRIRLLCKVDLKPNAMGDFTGLAVALILRARYGDNGDKVDKYAAILAVVDGTCLALLVLCERLVKVTNGVRSKELAGLATLQLA